MGRFPPVISELEDDETLCVGACSGCCTESGLSTWLDLTSWSTSGISGSLLNRLGFIWNYRSVTLIGGKHRDHQSGWDASADLLSMRQCFPSFPGGVFKSLRIRTAFAKHAAERCKSLGSDWTNTHTVDTPTDSQGNDFLSQYISWINSSKGPSWITESLSYGAGEHIVPPFGRLG